MKRSARITGSTILATLLSVSGVGAGSASTGDGSAEANGGLANVSVAYHPNMHGGGVVAIGEEQGYFKEEGLHVNAVRFTTGAPEIDALVTGQVDIGYLGPGAMPAVLRGEVQLLTIDHPDSNERLIATESSGVLKPADLKGKRVLFASGTTGEFVLREALKSAGLTMDDIVAVNSPDESSTTAYLSGTADIISVGPTFASQAIEQKPTKVLFNSADVQDFALPGFWVANKDFVRTNADLVDRFLRSFGRTNDYRAANLGTAVPVVQAYTGTPQGDLRTQVELTGWWTTQAINAAIANGDVERMLGRLNEMFQETGRLKQRAEVSTYFDREAVLTAYERKSTGAAVRADSAGFPWIAMVVGAFAVTMLAGILLIVRRART